MMKCLHKVTFLPSGSSHHRPTYPPLPPPVGTRKKTSVVERKDHNPTIGPSDSGTSWGQASSTLTCPPVKREVTVPCFVHLTQGYETQIKKHTQRGVNRRSTASPDPGPQRGLGRKGDATVTKALSQESGPAGCASPGGSAATSCPPSPGCRKAARIRLSGHLDQMLQQLPPGCHLCLETDPRSRDGWPDRQASSSHSPQMGSQEACRKPLDAGQGLDSPPKQVGPDLIGLSAKLSNLIKAASIMQTVPLNLITEEHCPAPQ